MREVELSAGMIQYQDTGGARVLLHGLMMDASLWDGPIAEWRALAPADAAAARWMRPVLKQPEIRRDAVRMLPSSRAAFLLTAAEACRASTVPPSSSGQGDRVMPPERGRALQSSSRTNGWSR
jgi:hypothetical protein